MKREALASALSVGALAVSASPAYAVGGPISQNLGDFTRGAASYSMIARSAR